MPVTAYHPELDTSHFLGIDDHRKYQLLLEVLQWMVMIVKPEIYQLVSSLNHFGACPY